MSRNISLTLIPGLQNKLGEGVKISQVFAHKNQYLIQVYIINCKGGNLRLSGQSNRKMFQATLKTTKNMYSLLLFSGIF